MRGDMFRRRMQSCRGGDLGTVDSEVTGIKRFSASGIRSILVGEDINIAQRKGIVNLSPPLGWFKLVRRVARCHSGSLLDLRCVLGRGELMEYHFLETLITLKPFLGRLVWLFVAAVPEAFDDVPETMVCYYHLAIHGLLADEFTD